MVCLAFQPFCALNPGIYIYYFGSWCFFVHWGWIFYFGRMFTANHMFGYEKAAMFYRKTCVADDATYWSMIWVCKTMYLYFCINIYLSVKNVLPVSPDSSSAWISAPDYVRDTFQFHNLLDVCWERFFVAHVLFWNLTEILHPPGEMKAPNHKQKRFHDQSWYK